MKSLRYSLILVILICSATAYGHAEIASVSVLLFNPHINLFTFIGNLLFMPTQSPFMPIHSLFMLIPPLCMFSQHSV